MLWIVYIGLVVLWLIAFVGFHVMGWYIHLLLVLAIAALVYQLTGRPIRQIWHAR